MTLADKLIKARKIGDILTALARYLWAKVRGGKLPADKMPTPALMHLVFHKGSKVISCDDTFEDARIAAKVEASHLRWSNAPRPRPPHPLEAAILDWWNRPTPVKAYPVVKKAVMPNFDHDADRKEFPQLDLVGGMGEAPRPQGELFEMPAMGPVDPREMSWLLWLFDQSGGHLMRQGRGAPWEMHLFIGALLHLGIGDRDSNWHRLPALSFEQLGAWLHPCGWPNHKRDKRRLPEALERLHQLSRFPLRCGGRVQIMFVDYSVEHELCLFSLRIPKGAAKGGSVDWTALCRYRLKSAALYRAYLAACAWIGRSARRAQGLTAEIPAPILGANGEPMRRKGGRVKRSRTELVPNPAAKFNPSLSIRDLTRMIGFNPDNRDHRYKTRRAFERLDGDDAVGLEREGKNRFRLWQPRPRADQS